MESRDSFQHFMAELKKRLRYDGNRTVTMTHEMWAAILEYLVPVYCFPYYRPHLAEADQTVIDAVRKQWNKSKTFIFDGALMYVRFEDGNDSALQARVKELEQEIAADDQIMKEWARVLDAIPPCPAHGSRCVPHALEWVNSQLHKIEAQHV